MLLVMSKILKMNNNNIWHVNEIPLLNLLADQIKRMRQRLQSVYNIIRIVISYDIIIIIYRRQIGRSGSIWVDPAARILTRRDAAMPRIVIHWMSLIVHAPSAVASVRSDGIGSVWVRPHKSSRASDYYFVISAFCISNNYIKKETRWQ